MRKVFRTPVATQGRSIKWSSHSRHATPPCGSFRFRSLQRLRKSRITRERWQLDEKHLQNTDSKPGSAYRMVKLFPPRGATFWQFPLPVCTKIVGYSTTETAGRKMSTEHQYQTGVGLSNGQITSARWCHLLLISPLRAFCDFQKRYYLGNSENWMRCF
jgi:hypothetical protein